MEIPVRNVRKQHCKMERTERLELMDIHLILGFSGSIASLGAHRRENKISEFVVIM